MNRMYTSGRYVVLGALIVVGMLGVGCAARQPPSALTQARIAYTEAEQNTQIAAKSPTTLREAKQALDRAETAWANEQGEKDVSHLAYLAEQRVEIAEVSTERELAIAERQDLSRERETILREARVREADMARVEAQRAQREAKAAQLRAKQAQRAQQTAATQVEDLRQQLGVLQAKTKETDRGTVLTLDSVLFETNKSKLKAGALQNLYPLVTYLHDYPDQTIQIEGFTDSSGSDTYNLDLSRRRAESVREFLAQNGVDSTRVSAQGYGEKSPVASNETSAGRQQNRRVEIVFPK